MSNTDQDNSFFCEEPWTGIFSVLVDGTVRCCPCYAQVEIGNIYESSVEEIWNAGVPTSMRASFSKGKLPAPCIGQLCPVVAGKR
jgi:MoaA/NifB/PqqE/SkfB family radical SAM enzyme